MPSIFDNSGTIEIKGLRELQEKLRALPDKVQDWALKHSFVDGAEVIRSTAEQLCPKKTGRLARAIQKSVAIKLGIVQAKIFVNRSKAFYAHLVEFGTAPHIITGFLSFGGKVVRRVEHPGAPAKPFMRPAFDQSKGEAVQAVADSLRTELEKLGRKK